MRAFSVGFLLVGLLQLATLGQDAESRIAQIDQRIFDCKAKIQRLERDKEQALEELRNGLFCSECKRSKSEIERAERVSFTEHLREVKGHPIASPGLIAEKAAFYDRQIAALQRQIADLERLKSGIADNTARQAELGRQRAAAQDRQRQAAAAEKRQRELQAQMDQLQRQQDRIYNGAVARGNATLQTGQAIANGVKQIGGILQDQMRQTQAENQRRREQERLAQEMENLKEELRESKREMDELRNQPSGRYGGDYGGGLDLPPPIPIYEPPGEERRQTLQNGVAPTVTFGNGNGASSSGYNFGGVAPVVTFQSAPYQPPQNLSDFIPSHQGGLEATRRANEEWRQQSVSLLDLNQQFNQQNASYTGPPRTSGGGSSLFDSVPDSRGFGPSIGDMVRDAARATAPLADPAKETARALFDGVVSGEASTLKDAARLGIGAQGKGVEDEVKKQMGAVALDWAKRQPMPGAGGKSYNDLPEDERQNIEVLQKLGDYMSNFAKKDVKAIRKAYDEFVKSAFTKPLNRFLDDDDLFKP